MALTSAPFPAKDPIVDRNSKPTRVLVDWATALQQTVDTSPSRTYTVTLTGQTAALGTTAIPAGSLSSGLYRVSTWARVTTPATVSSSLTVSVLGTSGTATVTLTGTAITGNTTGSAGSSTWLLKIDAATPISYSVAYASVGATSLVYELSLTLERVDA